MTTDPLAMTARDRLELHLALLQPGPHADHYGVPPEAVRCLRLLLHVLEQVPLPQDGPAALHTYWATVARLRAQQALLALPHDRTAPTTPPPARVAFGLARPDRGDWLLDTFLPDQTRLRVLTEQLRQPLDDPGSEHDSATADTVRDLVRCLHTYLVEVELGDAGGYLGFTVEGSLEPPR